MLQAARTAAANRFAVAGLRQSRSTHASRVSTLWRWRRITTVGRLTTQAVAASRAPPSSFMCKRGVDSENGLGFDSDRLARKRRKSISSSSLSATDGPGNAAAVGELEEYLATAKDEDVLDAVVVD
jgi:hypothetical protein